MNFGFVKALTGSLYATILVKLIILVLSKATLETAKRRGIHCHLKPDSTKKASSCSFLSTSEPEPGRFNLHHLAWHRWTWHLARRCQARMPKLSRKLITKEICQKVNGVLSIQTIS